VVTSGDTRGRVGADMTQVQKTVGSLSPEERLALERVVNGAAGAHGGAEPGAGDQAIRTSGGLVFRAAMLRPMEIACEVCGVRSAGADRDAAWRAYALHMYTAHGRTVSRAEARALARPVGRRACAGRGS